MTYLDEMAAFHARELERDGDAAEQRRWERWLSRVSVLTGIDNLDGNEPEDGYSLDGLYDRYIDGFTPTHAANWIDGNRGRV
jgi:hypothetical protein